MSCCNSYPACESDLPLACEPLEVTTEPKRLVAEDIAGCKKTISSPIEDSKLQFNASTNNIEWTPIDPIINEADEADAIVGLDSLNDEVKIKGTATATEDEFLVHDGASWKKKEITNIFAGDGTLVKEAGQVPSFVNGTPGQILKVNSLGVPQFANLSNWFSFDADTTLASGQYVLADTSAGTITLTLPLAPASNDAIVFADKFGTWSTSNLTIARNGSTINGLAENLVCDIDGADFTLIYNGSTWNIYA
jgi:hypothetical protein